MKLFYDFKIKVRDILIKTLDTFANKFENLNILFPNILRQYQKKKMINNVDNSNNINSQLTTNNSLTNPDDFDFEQAQPIHSNMNSEIQIDILNGKEKFYSIYIN